MDDMGVRHSATSKPVDRCHLHFIGAMAYGPEISEISYASNDRWAQHVNLWCPRSSLGRRTCKRRGCSAELQGMEEMEE